MQSKCYDVVIVGAGLSGIGVACHLSRHCPDKRLLILERRQRPGGTWDLFRYPGVRSDSDMLSYGFPFRPWQGSRRLADGPSIRRYLAETASEYGLPERMRCGVRVEEAHWCSAQRCWHLRAVRVATGEVLGFTCRFLLAGTGYFDHDGGYRPAFPGEARFRGRIIHPQHWPEDLDYGGKKVVVIGSGATAITLVPAMAAAAAHVTMVQRSPSYVFALPSRDRLVEWLQRILPARWVHGLVRWRNVWIQRALYLACRRWPRLMRRFLLRQVRRQLGPDIDPRHFRPAYLPWEQRLCVAPDGDLFRVLREGKAAVETDTIANFTEHGLTLASGKTVEADMIITATGLELQALGGMKVRVDGRERAVEQLLTYRGVLVESLPNLGWIFGYTNASWTLKVDLAARYLCRLFNYMAARGYEVVTPVDRGGNALQSSIMDSLQSGYIRRGSERLPRQGRALPWRVLMHYGRDKALLLRKAVADECLVFLPAPAGLTPGARRPEAENETLAPRS